MNTGEEHAAPAGAELIPRRVLFGNPERRMPRLSPDGTRLAWIAPHREVLNVWVAPMTVADGVDWAQARVVTEDTDRGIRFFGWARGRPVTRRLRARRCAPG